MGKHDLTNQQKTFRDSIGQKATVQRSEADAAESEAPNRLLAQLGQAIQEEPKFKLKGYTYKGSAAVHIFVHETLGQMDLVSQTGGLVAFGCPEDIAAKSFDDLLRSMKATYGRGHGKLRSGF